MNIPTTQICKRCTKLKEFPRQFGTSFGGRPKRICIACDAKQYRLKYPDANKARQKRAKDNYSKNKPQIRWNLMQAINQTKCLDCGFTDFRALHFHHRESSYKKFGIGWAMNHSYGWENLLAEAQKCDVLCPNCHRLRHYYNSTKTSLIRITKANSRKLELISYLKLPLKCSICDISEPQLLGFKYKDGYVKKYELMLYFRNELKIPIEEAAIEAQKCELLCLTHILLEESKSRGVYSNFLETENG